MYKSFTQLAKAIKDYNIIAENMYNQDKKGFLIGIASELIRIITKKIYNSKKIKGVAQDGL